MTTEIERIAEEYETWARENFHIYPSLSAFQAGIAFAQRLQVPAELADIGRLIDTQDNRITDSPIFIVQQKRSYVTESDYNNCRYEWRETGSGDYAGPEDDAEQRRLDDHFAASHDEPDGWKRFAMFDVWEFVTACFTEQGCKDYLARNGHNLKEPRIYAEGSYRNEEWRSVRSWLKSLAAAPLDHVVTAPEPSMDVSDEWLTEIWAEANGVDSPLTTGAIFAAMRLAIERAKEAGK